MPKVRAAHSTLTVTSWEDIQIMFISDERVQIRSGDGSETCNYSEMGFADTRGGGSKPNRAWIALRTLAERKGTIKDTANIEADWQKIERRIQEMRKNLREFFNIDDDPLPYLEGIGYRSKFKIACGPSFES